MYPALENAFAEHNLMRVDAEDANEVEVAFAISKPGIYRLSQQAEQMASSICQGNIRQH